MKKNFQNEIFLKKLLNLIIIDSLSKIENDYVVENLFLENLIHNLLELHNFLKFGKERYEKKLGEK